MNDMIKALIAFTPLPDCNYKYDYVKFSEKIRSGNFESAKAMIRQAILTDLWFILYFVQGIKSANKPFVVQACRDVEDGPTSNTLDIWARFHFKSTIITIAETVQYHLHNPDHCTCIFSYKKPAAEDFLDAVRKTYEKEIIKLCFPELVYSNPEQQSPSWSLQNGIVINRKNTSRKEATVEASGLIEGMATGKHFERRIYDDIETHDIAENPDQLNKCFSKYEMSVNLGTGNDSDVERVIGTFYSHFGPLVRIRDKKTIDGVSQYHPRIRPATHDGTPNGKPVLMSQTMLDNLKTKEHFFSQQLCDPTPRGEQKLNGSFLREVPAEFIPKKLKKVMIIDPAGDSKDGKGDAWSMMVIGVSPTADEAGACNVYITNALISPLGQTEAIEEAVRMYENGGVVLKLGIEKVGLSTVEIHVANALKAKGRRVTVEDETLVILRPAGRSKRNRIESALAWPLSNGKIYISMAVPAAYRERLKQEMDKFPYWHDDGLDTLSYLYDIINTADFIKPARDESEFERVNTAEHFGDQGAWMGM